jgi:hypothetical protein
MTPCNFTSEKRQAAPYRVLNLRVPEGWDGDPSAIVTHCVVGLVIVVQVANEASMHEPICSRVVVSITAVVSVAVDVGCGTKGFHPDHFVQRLSSN